VKTDLFEGNLAQCHYVYHQYHTDCYGIELGLPGWETVEPTEL